MHSVTDTSETPPSSAAGASVSSPPNRRWSIAARLTLAVICLAVPIETIILWTGWTSIQVRRAAELENAVLVGQALAAVVDGFAGDLQSTSLSIATGLRSRNGPLDQDAVGPQLQQVADQYAVLRAVFLTDTAGRLVATGTGGAIGFDLSSRSYVKALQGGQEAVWSGVTGLQTGETTVTFARVVRGPDNAPRGFLVIAFYPQRFVERLPIDLPEDARISVFDQSGSTLYDSDVADPSDVIADSQSIHAAIDGAVVRVSGQADPLHGDARFGAIVPVSRLRWAVAYTLPNAGVEAAVIRRSGAQAGGIGIIILAAAVTMVWVSRRETRPLQMLAQTADAIARGEHPTVPDVDAAAEVDRLATAIRVMSGAVLEREADLRAQREWLRESEERLRLAVESAPIVLFDHDVQLRYTWVGKPFPGLTADTMLGRTDPELFADAVTGAATALKQRALDSGARVEGEIDVPDLTAEADGSLRRWHLTVDPLHDSSGGVVGVSCAALDVTQQRALERLQQEFISLVSHELRNPLASVKGYAQLIRRRREYDERAIAAIIQQSDHLDRLISDLLDSSRLAAGRLDLRRRRVDLLDVVSASVEQARARAETHHVTLDVGLDPGDDHLYGLWDAQRLDQVFTNLLSNAVKYSPDGGDIRVRLGRRGDEAVVTVQDHGVGIAPDELAHLFDRFYRIGATAPTVQGLGIGLYLARELVEAHGGRIWAESDGVGHGTTIGLALPLASRAVSAAGQGRPVLVVDDDDSLRDLIADVLRDEGYRLLTARDGQEALDCLTAETPALILLDWMLPSLGGEELVAELRHRHPDLDVPIVVMTAGGVAHERAASIGATGFINKPFEIGVLLDQVARHLGRSPASADSPT